MLDVYKPFTKCPSFITHLGLIDPDGRELSGGDPPYERQPVAWIPSKDDLWQPPADLTFNVPAGSTVGGFACFGADGAFLGLGSLSHFEYFEYQGAFTLLAAETRALGTFTPDQ